MNDCNDSFQTKLDFETDMYIAQCKIENLEECLAKYKVSNIYPKYNMSNVYPKCKVSNVYP